MTQLFSYQGEWPQPLPTRVRLADGTTRTDPSSFTTGELEAWGYRGPFSVPSYSPTAQVLEWTGMAFTVRPMALQEKLVAIEKQWEEVRLRRNALLAESDWTQLPDAPVDAAIWAEYRQKLRDITLQPDPNSLDWPISP